MNLERILLACIFFIFLSSCSESVTYAPVTDLDHFERILKTSAHRVVKGEPLYKYKYKIAWRWPTRGRVINVFSATNKGVNIAGQQGEAIFAVAAGKVVYSGNGLRGYGNLIIIKHNNLYLSAYAHCRLVLVKDGDWVRQGQKIAEMGSTGSDKTMLHFEIRRAGKPIDPQSLFQVKNVH